jgi:hypothetical protein
MNESYAYFAVEGAFDPDHISERLRVSPTLSWRAGDAHPTSGAARESSRWAIHSSLARSEPLELHVVDVLEMLEENPLAFAAISTEFGGWLQLVGKFFDTYPGLNFDPRITALLAKYSLAVDFDFYFLAEP